MYYFLSALTAGALYYLCYSRLFFPSAVSRRQVVEAWLPVYGPRLHLLHYPSSRKCSWVLEQPAPRFNLKAGAQGEGAAPTMPGSMVASKSDRAVVQGEKGIRGPFHEVDEQRSLQGLVHLQEGSLKGPCHCSEEAPTHGCWLLDSATGVMTSLSALLTTELRKAVSVS